VQVSKNVLLVSCIFTAPLKGPLLRMIANAVWTYQLKLMPFYLPEFLAPDNSSRRLPYVKIGLNIDTRDLEFPARLRDASEL